ncbi:MAG: AAA family ATPase [Phycisphaerales bacterium]|nr:AAA family ATPase [Phycisphaerales bacterium]
MSNSPDLSDPVFRMADQARPPVLPWLWPDRIPIGALTLLVGDPAVGKSILATDLIAHVTTGRPWPDDPLYAEKSDPQRMLSAPYRGRVVFVTPEESLGSTIHPRLIAAGADPTAVLILDGIRPVHHPHTLPFSLTLHIDQLIAAIRALSWPRLVILDNLPALLAPLPDLSSNSSCPGEPRSRASVARALAHIAAAFSVAIVATAHLCKSRSHALLHRAHASLAFLGIARSVLLVARHPLEPSRCLLLSQKSSLAPTPPPLAFQIKAGPRIDWCPASLPDISPALHDLPAEERSALAEAVEWLTDFLSAGPRPARELVNAAYSAALSLPTLRRAKTLLGVRSMKSAADSCWNWQLPPAASAPVKSQDAQNGATKT